MDDDIKRDPDPDESGQTNPEESERPVESKPSGRHRSAEEALAEVRQSLREEEQQKQREKKPGFLASLTGRFKRAAARPPAEEQQGESPAGESVVDSVHEPLPTLQELAPEVSQAEQPAVEPESQLPLGTDVPVEPEEDHSTQTAPPAPETMPTVALRKNLFEPEPEPAPAEAPRSILNRIQPKEAEDYRAVKNFRQDALQDYTMEAEPEAASQQTSVRQSARRMWRDMRPLEKRMLSGAVVLIILFIFIAMGAVAFNALKPEPPPPTPTLSGIPYPISISLPGGWVFPLSRGTVQNGSWDPARAEWLEGTEISRWVALPWNAQLEAVLRTLKADDPITIFMSNNDSQVYKVKRIDQVKVDEIGSLESRQYSLFLILSKQNSDTRWVVSAAP